MAGELPFGWAPSGELTAYTPTLRERVSDWLRPVLFSDDRAGQEKANRLTNWAETMIPPFGFATSAYDAGRAGGEGDYLTAGTLGAMAFVPGGSKKGIRAYHGSPHSFDKFSMDKIGTGEGAQAYGHGLYFAENEGVAKGYKDALATFETTVNGVPVKPDMPEFKAVMSIGANGYDKALKQAEEFAAAGFIKQNEVDAIRALKDAKIESKPRGSMYEVNIDADPNAFLDWDKPLSEQPEVQARLATIGEAARSSTTKGVDKYISLENLLGDRPAVTAKLREAGIPGIKYLDAGSRGKGVAHVQPMYKGQPYGDPIPAAAWNQVDQLTQRYKDMGYDVEVQDLGTRNYVVFDDNLISIVRKYGIAGASAMLGYNLLESVNPAQADELKRIEAGK